MKRSVWWLMASGFALRGAMALRTGVINTDAPTFMKIAEGFLSGDFGIATRMGFHPLYPAFIAMGGGSETAAILVSILAGVLAGWPLWLLVRDLAGERAAFLAVAIYELHPAFINIQSDIFADGLFVLLVACSVSGAIRFWINGRGLWMAAIGCALGFLTKSEGLVLAGMVALTVGGAVLRERRPLSRPAMAAALALIIIVPFVIHLSSTAGTFRFSPKGIAMSAIAGQGEYVAGPTGPGRWAQLRESQGPLVSSLVYLGNQLWGNLWLNVLLLPLALFTAGRWGARMKAKGWIAAWIAAFLFAVWWTNFKTGHQISGRYLNPAIFLSGIFIGPFLDWLLERTAEPARVRNSVLGTVIILVLGQAVYLPVYGRRLEHRGYREAGEWILKRHGKPGAKVASPDDKIPYYAKGIPVEFELKPPDADYWAFTDRDAQQWAWDWKSALGPFRQVAIFPESPLPRERVVRVFSRD